MKKKRIALIATLAVSLVACAASLTACQDKGDKDAFSAPENVKVTNALLTWDEVENADNGYTVKINGKEVGVDETKLDLTSEKASANIKEGDNKLSVKVNATEDKKESKYSKEVTYKYTKPEDQKPPVGELSAAAKAFKAEVEALATVDLNSTKAQIDAAKTALDTALANYEKLSVADKTAVATQKTALDEKKTAYDNLITAINGQIADAAEALTYDFATADTDEVAEANYAKANELLAVYQALKDYVQAGVAEQYEAITEAKTAAENKIKASVNAAKDEVAAISNQNEITVEYYEGLTALKDKIEAFGAYATTLWNSEDTAKVTAEITRVVTAVFEVKKSDEAFGFGDAGKLYILRDYVNVLGEQIEYDTLSITYTVNDGAEQTGTLERNENGVYVYVISYNPDNENTFVYTVGDEKQVTLNFAAFKNNIYLTILKTDEEFTTAFNEKTDTLTINQAYDVDHTYADIYLASDIDVGDTKNDAHISISRTAIASKVPVKGGLTREELYRAIARSEQGKKLIGDSYEIRLVFYSEVEETKGVITRTRINNASVSEKFTLSLTERDYKFEIDYKPNGDSVFDLGVWPNNPGVFSLIGTNKIPNFITQFNELYPDLITAENAIDYFQILISAYVYEADDKSDAELKFTKVAPFKNMAYDYATFLREWSSYFFSNGGEDNTEIKFYLTLTIQLKETVDGKVNPLAKDFRDSASQPVTVQNNYDGKYTFKASDVTLTNECQMDRTNEPIFMHTFVLSNDIINGHVSHIELYIKNGDNVYKAYILLDGYDDNGNAIFTIHKNADGSDTGRALIKGGNEYYCSANDLNNWVNDNNDSTFNLDGEGWYFKTIIIDNAEDDYYLLGDGESEWVTFYKEPAPTEPEEGEQA